MGFNISDFRKYKNEGNKIAMITAYDYPTARLVLDAGIDVILVGDSLGMVVLGYKDTTKVTMDDMAQHCAAVRRGAPGAFIIGDMPFLSYGHDIKESILNAGRLISEGGCNAVKLEGGAHMAKTVEAIINVGIPVIGHIGYTPQSLNMFGRNMVRGKDPETAKRLFEDALSLESAGVCAVVLELVPSELSKHISDHLNIPTIGIGSGAGCDGQVLVINDMLHLNSEFSPKHNKVFSDVGNAVREAAGAYVREVKEGTFPGSEHSTSIGADVIEQLRSMINDKSNT